jgi:hypothetical protein
VGGSTGGSSGSGGTSSTGGSNDGGGTSSTGGSNDGGGTNSGGQSGAGSGSDPERFAKLMADAGSDCRLREMRVRVRFEEEVFAARLTRRVIDGVSSVSGTEELLERHARLGHVVQLRWAAGAADGAQVPVSAWVKQDRQSDEPRYRCFDGEVKVRENRAGDAYYVFAADVVYEGHEDGSCGARTSADEAVLGCLPDEY